MTRITILLVLFASCSSKSGPTATPASPPQPVKAIPVAPTPILDPGKYDLVDMLPANAGDMRLARAVAWKGRGGIQIPRDEQEAVGSYLWSSERSAFSQIITNVATATCKREAKDDDDYSMCGKGAKKITVAGGSGCYYPEEGKNCVLRIKGHELRAEGAFVVWPGCELRFKCGELGKKKTADVIAAAEDIGKWTDKVRRGAAASDDVTANRRILDEAMRNANEAERASRER